MTFLIRRISTTADGREIVRTANIAKAQLTLGRDAANDIHLPDLALDPQHAVLTSNDGRHVLVRASGGLRFGLNGQSVSEANIDAGDGAELRFGGHRITVALDGEGEGQAPAIALTILRTDELSHSALDRDEADAFSMRGLLPGRRVSAWAFALLVFAAFLIAPIWAYTSYRGVEERPQGYHADMSWTSGPLSSAHADLSGDCQSCHTRAFEPVTDNACKSCHEDVHDHAPVSRQLLARGDPGAWRASLIRIGEMFGRAQGRCVDCHTEHEGAGPMPATAQQFCSDCHGDMNQRLTDTPLGNAADFGTLHPQFRPLVQTLPGDPASMRRVNLAGNVTDQNGLKFPHNLHMQPDGGVARMARNLRINTGGGQGMECANCHRPTADRTRFEPVDMERDCQSCHSLTIENVGGINRSLRHGQPDQVVADLYAFYRSTPPDRPMNLGGMARRRPGQFAEGQVYNIYFRETARRPSRAEDAVRAVFSRGGACYDCHTIYAPGAGSNRWRVQKVHQTSRYMLHGWFDHADHLRMAVPGQASRTGSPACLSCHNADRTATASQLMLPDIASCRRCHGGENSGKAVESPCASCHEYHQGPRAGAPWQPSDERHRRDNDRRREGVTSVTDAILRRLYAG